MLSPLAARTRTPVVGMEVSLAPQGSVCLCPMWRAVSPKLAYMPRPNQGLLRPETVVLEKRPPGCALPLGPLLCLSEHTRPRGAARTARGQPGGGNLHSGRVHREAAAQRAHHQDGVPRHPVHQVTGRSGKAAGQALPTSASAAGRAPSEWNENHLEARRFRGPPWRSTWDPPYIPLCVASCQQAFGG